MPIRKIIRRSAGISACEGPQRSAGAFHVAYMCMMWRDFDRAERHMDLARTMNPNDPLIQIFWAWVESCVGNPERASPAAEIAFRLSPCHPSWCNYYLSHIQFRLGRDQEAVNLLERLIMDAPARRHPRYMALRAAACGHLGRIEEAQRCAWISIEWIGILQNSRHTHKSGRASCNQNLMTVKRGLNCKWPS